MDGKDEQTLGEIAWLAYYTSIGWITHLPDGTSRYPRLDPDARRAWEVAALEVWKVQKKDGERD